MALSAFTLFYTTRITKPLEDLTRAADQADRGNYDFALEYDGDDEVGRLTRTFKRMANHVKSHIDDLSERVYVDALTSVKNKGAFSDALDELQQQLDSGDIGVQFAMAFNRWEQVRVTNGIAVYDPQVDRFVIDTVRRADKTMYANKHARKQAKKEQLA